MAIKRYVAVADNTITNAFESNLATRGTGSNMGAADSLEVFSLYGQVSSSSGLSSELSRILIKFPVSASEAGVTSIREDRVAGNIPTSGSVKFYLKMYNAEHPFTLARDFQLNIYPASSSWEEGYGLDMEEYKDITYDNTGSNWVAAAGTDAAATAIVTWYAGDRPEAGDTITIIDAAGVSKAYIAAASQDLTSDPPTWHASNTTTTQVDSLQNCIESANGHNGSITVSQDATGLIMTLTSSTTGEGGNTTITVAGATSGQINATNFSGGSSNTPWATTGGDYRAAYNFTASFANGWEDLEVEMTPLVERWMQQSGTTRHFDNYGLLLKLTNAQEDASVPYYTKKFFARSTEFFFKRPVIEARWDSRTKDDRGNFYYSSSLAPAADNLNTIYLYNYVRGRLVDIPNSASVGTTGSIFVSLYSGSSAPAGAKLLLPAGGGVVAASDINITGGWVSTGIYSASVAVTAAATPLTKLFDVWHNGAFGAAATLYYTSSIAPLTLAAYNNAPTFEHITTITNLKSEYSRQEDARLRLYVRQKNWNPNIYNVATSAPPNETIMSASYKIVRMTDELNVISYGTGSDRHTYLSHDVSGNYLDLDVSLLEAGYAYGIKFGYYNPSIKTWVEQPETFKFRVEE